MERTCPTPWESLPTEIWRTILCNLSLYRLRLFKLVSRDMANQCRWVLRSKQWQVWVANAHAMQKEVDAFAWHRPYTLPLTVRLFADNLTDPPCIATIHRFKCRLYDWYNTEFLDPTVPDHWNRLTKFGKVDLDILDMHIEVHGIGIVSSPYALRKLLGDELSERGVVPNHSQKVLSQQVRDELAKTVDGTVIYQDLIPTDDHPGWGDVEDGGSSDQMDLWELFQQVSPATDTGAMWRMHASPHWEYNHSDREARYHTNLLTVGMDTPGLLT